MDALLASPVVYKSVGLIGSFWIVVLTYWAIRGAVRRGWLDG